MLRKVGVDSAKKSQRTTRLGPQDLELPFSPEDVAFRGAPIPPSETTVTVSTLLGCKLKSLVLWAGSLHMDANVEDENKAVDTIGF